MENIIWNNNLSVGVKLFDEDHKQLIGFINKLNHALKIKSTQKTMEEILTGLVNYTKIHFSHEEEAMDKYKFPGFENHMKAHQDLTSQVNNFMERYKTGKSSFSLELMNFLHNWLITHIQETDMMYKEFFKDKNI